MHALTCFAYPQVLFAAECKLMVNPHLPQDCQKITGTLQGFLFLAQEALVKFKSRELRQFDALGGTCTCHLTALKIEELAEYLLYAKSNDASLQAAEQQLQAALHAFHTGKLKKGAYSIDELLQTLGVHVELPASILFLIYAYLLTVTKAQVVVNGEDATKKRQLKPPTCCQTCNHPLSIQAQREVTDEKALLNKLAAFCGQMGNLSPTMVHNAVKYAKERFAEQSVNFIRIKADLLGDAMAQQMFQEPNCRLVDGKKEVPDFYSLTTMIKACLLQEVPVLLKFKKYEHAHSYQEPLTPFDSQALFLKPIAGHFVPATPSERDLELSLIICELKRSHTLATETPAAFLERILCEDFSHLCALDAAQHKPYTDQESIPLLKTSDLSEELAREKQQIEQLKKEAVEKGCSLDNQKLFVLSHIYCDVLHKQLQAGIQLYQPQQGQR